MGYLLTVFTDELETLQRVVGTNDREVLHKLVGTENRPEQVTAAVTALVERGFAATDLDPGAMIEAFQVVCRAFCRCVGELDHFRYDEEDFPELWEFQCGDTSSGLLLPVDLDTGIPAVNHWPLSDVRRLRERMSLVELASRKPYTHSALHELHRWLTDAVSMSSGLFVFFE